MNIQILSDRHEHVCKAIDRTTELLTKYHIKDHTKMREATIQHYMNLLAVELEILKNEH